MPAGLAVPNRHRGPGRCRAVAPHPPPLLPRAPPPYLQQPIVKRDLSQLIPRGTIAGLHPAQCRAPSRRPITSKEQATAAAVCGWRLGQRTPPADWDKPAPEYLALQQRILAKLARVALRRTPSATSPSSTSPAHSSSRRGPSAPHRVDTARRTPRPLCPPSAGAWRPHAGSPRTPRRSMPAPAPPCSSPPKPSSTPPDLRQALAPLARPIGHGTKKPRIYYGWDLLFKKSRHEWAIPPEVWATEIAHARLQVRCGRPQATRLLRQRLGPRHPRGALVCTRGRRGPRRRRPEDGLAKGRHHRVRPPQAGAELSPLPRAQGTARRLRRPSRREPGLPALN